MSDFERAKNLITRIEEAFEDVSYPGDDNIVANTIDPEGQWIKNDLQETHWKDLLQDRDKLFRHYPSILFFTPLAFKFFLPAYLIMAIDFDESDMVGETLINTLAPKPHGLKSAQDLIEDVEVLTLNQKMVSKQFLQFIRDEYLPDSDDIPAQALNVFWNDIAI